MSLISSFILGILSIIAKNFNAEMFLVTGNILIFIVLLTILLLKILRITNENNMLSAEIKKYRSEFVCIFENETVAYRDIFNYLIGSKTVRILGLRCFAFTQTDKEWNKIFSTEHSDKSIHILLLNPNSNEVIKHALQLPSKSPSNLQTEINISINELKKNMMINPNLSVRTHDEIMLYRLIFTDRFIYIFFLPNEYVKESPVYKVRNDSTLFRLFDKYFNTLWFDNSCLI